MAFTIEKLKAIQINPATILIIKDSIKNCIKISVFVAQIAFLIQISLVLSITETSIIFITQIHPTRSEIVAIPAKNIVIVPVTAVIDESISDIELIENGASFGSVVFVYLRSSSFI